MKTDIHARKGQNEAKTIPVLGLTRCVLARAETILVLTCSGLAKIVSVDARGCQTLARIAPALELICRPLAKTRVIKARIYKDFVMILFVYAWIRRVFARSEPTYARIGRMSTKTEQIIPLFINQEEIDRCVSIWNKDFVDKACFGEVSPGILSFLLTI